AVSPDGDTVLIVTCDSDGGATVHVVDARANVTTDVFLVDAPVTQLTVSRDGERAYLLTADGVVVVCGRTYEVLGSVATPASPSCMVESPDGSRLYVADHDGVVTVAAVTAPASEPSLQDQFALDDAVSRLLALEPAV
ncbi:MAG: YncE family protein, partial [Mycobacterium sp.]